MRAFAARMWSLPWLLRIPGLVVLLITFVAWLVVVKIIGGILSWIGEEIAIQAKAGRAKVGKKLAAWRPWLLLIVIVAGLFALLGEEGVVALIQTVGMWLAVPALLLLGVAMVVGGTRHAVLSPFRTSEGKTKKKKKGKH